MSYGRNCQLGYCDLIRPPILKIGQHDLVKVHLSFLEVGYYTLHPLFSKGIPIHGIPHIL